MDLRLSFGFDYVQLLGVNVKESAAREVDFRFIRTVCNGTMSFGSEPNANVGSDGKQ